MKKIILTISIILLLVFVISCKETPETFKVIYHDNGSTSGFPPVDNKEYKSGEYATVLDKNTLEKTGYEFGGWKTNQDNSGTRYNEGDKIEIKNINIFLFAVWE